MFCWHLLNCWSEPPGKTLKAIDANRQIKMSDLIDEARSRSPMMKEMGREVAKLQKVI